MYGLISALGALTLLIALALFAYALIGDRARGRRRCPRCWHDLTGTPGLRCPECGREARCESGLYRTRRPRGRFILAAVVLLAGVAFLSTPAVISGSWVRAVPTTVLVWSFPTCTRIIEDPTSDIAPIAETLLDEIDRRADTGPMWHWQRRALVRSSVAVYERSSAKDPRSYARRQLNYSSAFVGEQLLKLLDIVEAHNYDSSLLTLAHRHSRESLPDRDAVIERLFVALESGKLGPLSRIDTIDVLIHLGADGDRLLPHVVAGIQEVYRRGNRQHRIIHSSSVANLARLPDALDQALPRLIELAGSEDGGTALDAIQTLGNMGPDAAPAVPVLIEALQRPDANGFLTMWVARTCFAIGPAAVDARDALAASPEGPREFDDLVRQLDLVRQATLHRLDGDDAGALDLLAEAALSTDKDRRESALWLLGDLKDHPDRVLPLLFSALKSGDASVQQDVLRSLSNHRDHAALIVPVIADYLRTTEDPSQLRQALGSLENLGPAAAPLRPDLEQLARHPDWLLRNRAQRILFQLKAAPSAY